MGYTDDISVVAKDYDESETKTHQVKQDIRDGAAGRAIIGAIVGVTAGIASIAIPGFGALAIFGPLAASGILASGATGAVAGGLVGALVDAGIPDEKAKMYADQIRRGDVLVTVSVEKDEDAYEVQGVLDRYNVEETQTQHANAF